MSTRLLRRPTGSGMRWAPAIAAGVLVGVALTGCVGDAASSPSRTPSAHSTPRATATATPPASAAPGGPASGAPGASGAPAAPGASGGGTSQAGRETAIQACEAVRDTISGTRDQAIAGQNRGLELAKQALAADPGWQQLHDHMAALASAPFPKPGDADADWQPHLNAYFTLADQDCRALGVTLPQGG